ncbi:hypothetical protein JKI95_08460 [Corynebacterium aquatimens]|uniref:hypothetical protein n=1 Tax=Corynebacterium TaxID=1716 RepID=UPI001F441C00|nr:MULTISPECIES: hypothetical protein [Corynebacterium]QYH19231.1 hypothetical protein JKI95_08460 [Corynebacterium aquatimens]UIZ91881.1 hypothetical protein JZY91_09375 [Corynebacterium sp. CNCTC7651]
MFKNRVRTAALAGAIAVATGVSGLTVPAYADPISGDHHNQPDASKSTAGTEKVNASAVAGVKAADVLRDAATADRKAIANHDFVNFEDLKFRPVEADSKAKADKKVAEATELLNKAVATLNDIDTTLKAVQAETNAANDAWAKYATAVSISRSEYEALQKLENDLDLDAVLGKTGPFYFTGKINPVDKKAGQDGHVAEVAKSRETLEGTEGEAGLTEELNNELKKLDPTAEGDIEKINKLTTYQAKLNSFLNGWTERDALYADAINKTNTATSRNIAVIKDAYKIAQANVRAARTLQAYYIFASRWLDLYEADVLKNNEDTDVATVRAEYENILFNAPSLRDRAGDAIANNSSKNKAYDTDNEIDSNLAWESGVQRVRLIDKRYNADVEAAAAADAAKEAQSKDLNAQLANIAQELKKLNEAKATGQNNSNTPSNTPAPNNPAAPAKSSLSIKKEDGSVNGGVVAAIVIGIIAALGAIATVALPTVQQFLPKF